MTQKQIALSETDQTEAFEEAADQVAEDVEQIDADVHLWGGEPTDGEIVRVLSEAYTGSLSIEPEAETHA